MQNLIKIIKSTETHFQTCYNALAVLEALSLRGKEHCLKCTGLI